MATKPKAKTRSVRRNVERGWGVRIGQGPRYAPYLMLRDDGKGPLVCEWRDDADEARLTLPNPRVARVVRVRLEY